MTTTSAVVLMLVALSAAAGLVILLAPVMIVRYLLSGPVLLFLSLFIVLIAVPLLYAWRSRAFRA